MKKLGKAKKEREQRLRAERKLRSKDRLCRIRSISRFLSILSATVGLAILFDVLLPDKVEKLILSERDTYSSFRFGMQYEFVLDGSETVTRVSVSEVMYRRARRGDYVNVTHSPVFGLDKKVELLERSRPVEIQVIRSWLKILLFLAFSILPLISLYEHDSFLNWGFQISIICCSLIFIVMGIVSLSHFLNLGN